MQLRRARQFLEPVLPGTGALKMEKADSPTLSVRKSFQGQTGGFQLGRSPSCTSVRKEGKLDAFLKNRDVDVSKMVISFRSCCSWSLHAEPEPPGRGS